MFSSRIKGKEDSKRCQTNLRIQRQSAGTGSFWAFKIHSLEGVISQHLGRGIQPRDSSAFWERKKRWVWVLNTVSPAELYSHVALAGAPGPTALSGCRRAFGPGKPGTSGPQPADPEIWPRTRAGQSAQVTRGASFHPRGVQQIPRTFPSETGSGNRSEAGSVNQRGSVPGSALQSNASLG